MTADAPEISQETRIAAYAVCVDGDKVLLARWLGPNRKLWTLPGGGVEHGEDPLDAAVREALEETGYTIEIDSLLGLDSVHRRYPRDAGRQADFHAIRIIYAARVTGGTLRHEVGGSTDRAGWFGLAEVSGLDRVGLVDVGLEFHRTRPQSGRLPGRSSG